MVKFIPYMIWVVSFEHDTITFQGRNIDIIHRVILQNQSVVACLIGITKHHLQFLFRAMIIAFMVAFECAS